MAGTYMSIVHGFGGMRIKEGKLSLNPNLPEAWTGYSFRLVFRGRLIKVKVCKNLVTLILEEGESVDILLFDQEIVLEKSVEHKYKH